MHWQIHKDSNAHHAVAERRGERLPVAIAFGRRPGASPTPPRAPLPADIDEYLFAGFLRGERVEMVDCLTVPLQVPANAQVVLEGWLEPGERRAEGPFGDHTGFYTPVEPFPALHHRLHDDAEEPGLPDDRRRPAARRGRADRQGDRADLPAAAQAD